MLESYPIVLTSGEKPVVDRNETAADEEKTDSNNTQAITENVTPENAERVENAENTEQAENGGTGENVENAEKAENAEKVTDDDAPGNVTSQEKEHEDRTGEDEQVLADGPPEEESTPEGKGDNTEADNA